MDCRTCKHNTYLSIKETKWVSCGHPITLLKQVRWEKGDPAFVNYRTADVPVSEIHNLQDCPKYEEAR